MLRDSLGRFISKGKSLSEEDVLLRFDMRGASSIEEPFGVLHNFPEKKIRPESENRRW